MTSDELSDRPINDISPRQAALVGAFALLLLALLAAFSYVFVFESKIVEPRDATATANNILASEGLFRASLAASVIWVILDVVVAWAFYVVFRSVNRSLSMLMAWLRLAYTAAITVSLANLFDALQLLKGSDYSPALDGGAAAAAVMSSVASFQHSYDFVLAMFGVHLLVLGFLVFRSGFFPKWLGVLVVIAGLGYVIDTLAIILVADYDFSLGQFLFVGEALLIVWLFLRGIRGFPTADRLRSEGESRRPARQE